MAMALRTMAEKLKQKIPAAVQRVFASSRAPATSSSTTAGIDRLDPEIRQAVEELVNISRKNSRDEALARGAGIGLGAITLSLWIHRLNHSTVEEMLPWLNN